MIKKIIIILMFSLILSVERCFTFNYNTTFHSTDGKFEEIYKDNKNLTNKPIFIDFYADW